MKNLKKYFLFTLIAMMVLSVTIPIIASALEGTISNRQEQNVFIYSTDNDADIFIIQDEDPPLAMFEPGGPAWAVANLVLAAAGVALAVMMGIRAISKDRSYNYDDYDGCDDYEKEQDDNRSNSKILAFAIPVLAIMGTILFMLTQDMSLSMGMVDSWTLAQASLFAASLLSYIFLSRKEKTESEQETSGVV